MTVGRSPVGRDCVLLPWSSFLQGANPAYSIVVSVFARSVTTKQSHHFLVILNEVKDFVT
jgi:hypothetical protein